MKESFKITKDQVLEVYEWGDSTDKVKMKGWFPKAFPKAFPKDLELGKWYRLLFSSKTLIYFDSLDREGNIKGYGISNFGWRDNRVDDNHWGKLNEAEDWVLATDKEVEEVLVNQVKLRGYNKENTISLSLSCNDSHLNGFHFESRDNSLYYAPYGNGGKLLFRNGKWAEIREGLVIGNWYKHENGHIVNYQGKSSGYGWTSLHGWYNNNKWSFDSDRKSWKIVNEIEVEECLIKEANKRGYQERVKIDFIAGVCELNHKKPYLQNGALWYGDCRVFVNGEWAKIIERSVITKKEAERILNKTIVEDVCI